MRNLELNTLYEFTCDGKVYYIYNNVIYSYNTENNLREVSSDEIKEYNCFRKAPSIIVKYFLRDLFIHNLSKYKIVKYDNDDDGIYCYFNGFSDSTKQHCKLTTITYPLLNRDFVDISNLTIVKDEDIIEQQLMLYNLFSMVNGKEYDTTYLPKDKQWYTIEYINDSNKRAEENIYLDNDRHNIIIGNKYICATHYVILKGKYGDDLIPIKNIIKISKLKNEYINNNSLYEYGDIIVFNKDNEKFYCTFKEYVNDEHSELYIHNIIDPFNKYDFYETYVIDKQDTYKVTEYIDLNVIYYKMVRALKLRGADKTYEKSELPKNNESHIFEYISKCGNLKIGSGSFYDNIVKKDKIIIYPFNERYGEEISLKDIISIKL